MRADKSNGISPLLFCVHSFTTTAAAAAAPAEAVDAASPGLTIVSLSVCSSLSIFSSSAARSTASSFVAISCSSLFDIPSSFCSMARICSSSCCALCCSPALSGTPAPWRSPACGPSPCWPFTCPPFPCCAWAPCFPLFSAILIPPLTLAWDAVKFLCARRNRDAVNIFPAAGE